MNRKHLALLFILLTILKEYTNNQFDNNNYKLCKDISNNRITLMGEKFNCANLDTEDNNEYTHLKIVHLFFYNKDSDSDSNFNFILYKNKNTQDEVYHHMFNEIINSDNGSIYSISRFLTEKFGEVFTDDFISKLQSTFGFEVKNNNKNF